MEVRVTQCRSCKADIVWVKTPKGKNMPIDSTPVADGRWMLEEGDGGKPNVVHASNTHGALEGDMARYQSHFDSCPNASQHSKPRQPDHPQRGAPGAVDAASRIIELVEENEQLKAQVRNLQQENAGLRQALGRRE
jgi:hypothetical protein